MMNLQTILYGTMIAYAYGFSVDIANTVNSLETTWTATTNPVITNITERLGTLLSHEQGFLQLSAKTYAVSEFPENFDVRDEFENCANVVGHVRDQSNCGSCWAFGSTEAFNDRYCISTGDNTKVFSPTDTLACCSGLSCGLSMGCNGGQPSGAWKWFANDGVVEGGDYGNTETCLPYTFPSCAHHTDSTTLPSCDTLDTYTTPKCVSTCEYGDTTYSQDKFYAKNSYSLHTLNDMQQDLMNFGTLTVAFSVYEDFETYESGVYQHVSGKYLGGHAVKMIGWGVDNGTPYWTCVNSWNSEWGEQGTFRILRGSDECGIESNVVAGEV